MSVKTTTCLGQTLMESRMESRIESRMESTLESQSRSREGQKGFVGVDVYAHRGSTLLAPENTLPAFELALEYGADVLEIDVRLSRDGHLMVIHDDSVDRTCNGHGKVSQMRLSALKKLDAAYHFKDLEQRSYRDQGTQLITLPELLEHYPTRRVNIDIKDNNQQAAHAVANALEQFERCSNVAVGSFHSMALAQFREAAPHIDTAASRGEVANLYFNRRYKKNLRYRYLQIPTSYIGLPLATPAFIQHAQEQKINVVFWTINTTKSMQMLIERGVNGFVTDRVDLASRLMQQ